MNDQELDGRRIRVDKAGERRRDRSPRRFNRGNFGGPRRDYRDRPYGDSGRPSRPYSNRSRDNGYDRPRDYGYDAPSRGGHREATEFDA